MKSDVIFDLENASWPALLMDAGGVVVRANRAALKTFGAALEKESPGLAALWSLGNPNSAEQFLNDGETAVQFPVPLQLTAGGGAKVFSALLGVHSRNERKFFLLQLLPVVGEPGSGASGADTVMIHRQKLDC